MRYVSLFDISLREKLNKIEPLRRVSSFLRECDFSSLYTCLEKDLKNQCGGGD
jgi:hypothetical protein